MLIFHFEKKLLSKKRKFEKKLFYFREKNFLLEIKGHRKER
jgi:hypothetical protein